MAKVLNETAKEAVNQTANATSQATNQATQYPMLQDPVFLGAIGFAILVGAIFLIIKYFNGKSNETVFETKSLRERLKEKQVSPAVEFGRKTKKRVDYGMKELGRLEKYYKTTETVEEKITSKKIVESIQKDNEKKAEELDEEIKEDNSFKNITMIVGPTGFFTRLKMNIKTKDPIKNPHLSVYSVPKSAVNVSDRVSINDEKVDWNYSGGIYYSNDVKGMNTMLSYSSLSLLEDVAETFANKGKLLQQLDQKHAEWTSKKEIENQAFIDYMKEKEGIDADSATD